VAAALALRLKRQPQASARLLADFCWSRLIVMTTLGGRALLDLRQEPRAQRTWCGRYQGDRRSPYRGPRPAVAGNQLPGDASLTAARLTYDSRSPTVCPPRPF